MPFEARKDTTRTKTGDKEDVYPNNDQGKVQKMNHDPLISLEVIDNYGSCMLASSRVRRHL